MCLVQASCKAIEYSAEHVCELHAETPTHVNNDQECDTPHTCMRRVDQTSVTTIAPVTTAKPVATKPTTAKPSIASAKWTVVGSGGCRTASGGSINSYAFAGAPNLATCQTVCEMEPECTGVEYFTKPRANDQDINCQLQNFAIGGSGKDSVDLDCHQIDRSATDE
jgi:hypothetical protein